MAFLVPKPIERQIKTKTLSNCIQNVDKSSILDKIRDLCRTPKPIVERLDERVFVSTIFDDIREMCRIPVLLTTIEEQLKKETEERKQESNKSLIETKVYQKKKIENYSDSNDSNSFDIISKSKLFATLVRGRPNRTTDHSLTHSSDKNCIKINAKINTKHKNSVNKNKKSPKKRKTINENKNDRKPVKSLLSIDCDITSKINEYSKQYSKPNKKTINRKTCKKFDANNTFGESTDSGFYSSGSYESIASPLSTSNTMSYSLPATPNSSVDSMSSSFSCETSSSVLSQIRNSLNPKFETYRQYIQRSAQNEVKIKKNRRKSKQELHFKEKVLQWSDKICLGNTTPVHNIEYLATPPGSPQKESVLNFSTSDEFNAMIESLENFETNDGFGDKFNEMLSELFSDPIT